MQGSERHTHQRYFADGALGLDLAAATRPDADVGNKLIDPDVFRPQIGDLAWPATRLDQRIDDEHGLAFQAVEHARHRTFDHAQSSSKGGTSLAKRAYRQSAAPCRQCAAPWSDGWPIDDAVPTRRAAGRGCRDDYHTAHR